MSKKIQLPPSDHLCDVTPGGIKKLKTENRRSDSTYLVDPFKLVQDPAYNVRVRTPEYEAYVHELAENMVAEGYDPAQPVSACAAIIDGADVLLLRAGNTRLEAARLAIEMGASFDTIPVVIRPKTDNQVDHIVDLVRSNSGRPLNPVELAIVVKRLSKAELSEAEIARKLGFAPSYINNLMLLASAPPALSMMVVNAEVSAAIAFETIRAHGPAMALEQIRDALDKAKQAGKTKVTPSQMPGARFKTAVKKAAPKLFEALQALAADPGFASVPDDLRERLVSLLSELEAHQDDAGANPPADPIDEGAGE